MGLPISGEKIARFVPILVAGVVALMLASWVVSDPVENLRTDWTAFDNAGDRLRAGETIYRPWSAESEPLPYLYPPFALWLSLPLTAVGFWGSFLISAFVPLCATIGGLVMFSRAARVEINWSTPLVVAIASGTTIGSTLIGQYSGLYVLAFGAATLLYCTNRRTLAGVVLGLLWLKPNIAIVVPVALVWARSWRSLRGFIGASVGVVALSVPFGIEQWRGFFANVENMAELQERGLVPVEKMVTLLAAIQRVFGLEQELSLSIGIWLCLSAVLGVAVLSLWSPARLAESPLRSFAALAVFAVAANPRLYFYDGALAVLGMLGLWAHAHMQGGAFAKQWIPVLAWGLWIGSWGNIWPELNSLVGLSISAALVVTAIDARRAVSGAMVTASDVTASDITESVDVSAADLAA